MRDHHALGSRRGTRGVVDREQVGLFQPRVGRLRRRLTRDPVLVVGPSRGDLNVLEGDGDEVLNRGQVGADVIDHVRELGVDEDDLRAGVLQHVLEVGRDQPVVHRHDDRADRGGRVEGLQELVRVGRDDADAVAFADPGGEQGVCLLIDADVELGPGEALVAVDDGLGRAVELGGASQKIIDQQRDFHVRLPQSIAVRRVRAAYISEQIREHYCTRTGPKRQLTPQRIPRPGRRR